ncbi:MAG: DUF2190 family protein [Candidatus Brocadiae bacterium]|nr:DUF2190 family protein [Candidatus Brocadiia bacterium]
MASTYIQDGKTIDFEASANQDAGDVAEVGDIVGVVQEDVDSGDTGALEIEHVQDLPKAAVTVTAGQKAFWDSANEEFTNVRGANKFAGFFVEGAASGAATAKIKLMNVSHAPKNNYAATAAPGVGDDAADGYEIGSLWFDISAKKLYVCFSAAAGAADWNEITQA